MNAMKKLSCAFTLCLVQQICLAVGPVAEAEAAARQKISDMSNLNDHIEVDAKDFVVAEAEAVLDGGWQFELRKGECIYLIYVNVGIEIDVNGISGGCFLRKMPPDGNSGENAR